MLLPWELLQKRFEVQEPCVRLEYHNREGKGKSVAGQTEPDDSFLHSFTCSHMKRFAANRQKQLSKQY